MKEECNTGNPNFDWEVSANNLVDLLTNGGLVTAKCAEEESHPCVIVWSASVHDQLAAFLKQEFPEAGWYKEDKR